MGSQGNPQAWIPYMTSKDCTQGICSLYCPQWCYLVFPPPPPLQYLGDGDDTSSSGPNFSPLIIAIIGVLASAFLLVTYYTVISKFCGSNGSSVTDTARDANSVPDGDPSSGPAHEPWYISSTGGGLDEALIRSIAVCKYKRGAGMVEGTCSVCLSEFQEDESVRLLPKCTHAFHVPCIDTWLKSHSNCPLCRSEVAFTGSFPVAMPLPPVVIQLPWNENQQVVEDQPTDPGRTSTHSASSDVTDQEEATEIGDHAAKSQSLRISSGIGNNIETPTPTDSVVIEVGSDDSEGLQPIRRSFSMGHSCLTVADILTVDQDEEDHQVQESSTSCSTVNHYAAGSANESSLEMCKTEHKRGFLHCAIDRPVPMKRSLSSGRLSLSRHGTRRTKGARIPV
ncbi:RING-H2 finger protein ATL52-like [Punica granatum]|uniref:RING-type E3 ubiquitin transferase n=2 Tax=Punica granatum TaxID=22663 RepID=A0A218XUE6_PUNGR|nr:RING-H2 finger protein ATL52-like [Punica granatum]OWM88276.1 hypothetical protein CDL15_Pgr003688 [Punica granatum]PKI46875.1 hypothetical protein CRG98_032686 [Punica granatum]